MALDNYKNLEPFRFWCQTVLPSVYDDSLSYYELLCKVVKYLNEMNDNIDTLHGVVEDYTQRFEELKSYVDNYFENLNVQEEINTKLDEMAESGALTTLLEPFIPALVTKWLEENIKPTTPPVDSTLSISGAAADAASVGAAIYANRARTNTPFPFVRYTPTETPFSVITDMPSMSEYRGRSANFTLGNNFKWTLLPDVTYRIIKYIDLIVVASPASGEVYIGSYSKSNVDSWLPLINIDPTLSVSGAAADAASVGTAIYADRARTNTPFPFVRYTPTETPFSVITDMPSMSEYRGYTVNFTLGNNFKWTLLPDVTYRIIKYIDLIIVASPASKEMYIGSYDRSNVDSWFSLVDTDIKNEDAIQVYTNFEFIDGKVYQHGILIDKPENINLTATKKLPCNGNTVYYSRFPNYSYGGTTVVFFNKVGETIGYERQQNFEAYNYESPDGTQQTTGYLQMLKFTTPADAAFFAFNWSLTESNKPLFYISNIPLFLIGFSQPNITIKENSPLLVKKDKTLCVIGPSGVMIDRLYRTAAGDYISGFQEHLRAYYKDIVSYGYSSATYAVNGNESPSIYEYITQGVGSMPAKDFTSIDEVLLIQSGSALSTLQVGNAGGLNAETVDATTMIGSIRGIVQYILAQNPKCKIYITSFYKYNNSLTNVQKVYEMHTATKELCDNLGLTYIDLWSNAPFNYSNYTADNLIYTYDGGHANSNGNKEIASVLKKYMICV